MTAPAFPTLGASTLARKWVTEIDTGAGESTWTVIGGVTNCQFEPDTGNWVDDSDYGTVGKSSETKTSGKANVTLSISRKLGSDGVSYDAGQEALRAAAEFKYGTDNNVTVRIFEYNPDGGPRVQAYSGTWGVDWVPQGGDNNALDMVQVTLHPRGDVAAVSHPYPAGS